ncbi:polysaccharide lyase 8 family protein [Erysipelothrix anatis]|uniref:polysaccharide lyase 8 family protein n=1 Tax=Erysipelothrix anatis TaxID=2683713 RepID=UPI0013571594|nr:polysaccharide lyase 8 family protein [Erysipelothrix anatis]
MKRLYKLGTILLFIMVLGIESVPFMPIYGDEAQDIEVMTQRWIQSLTGNLDVDTDLQSNVYVKDYVQKLSNDAMQVNQTLNKDTNRTSLWARNDKEPKHDYLSRNVKNIGILTKAYATYGTVYYQDSAMLQTIKDALRHIVEIEQYNGEGYYGNWWNWQIGIPHEMINILFMIQDTLTPEELNEYIQILKLYVPDPYKQLLGQGSSEVFVPFVYTGPQTSGANRTDFAYTRLGIGILDQNPEIIAESIESIKGEFDYVTQGEGFYDDGSFIFHENKPYVGSYGIELIKAVTKILTIVSETTYDLPAATKERFVAMTYNATVPVMFKGTFLPFVKGRSIAREYVHNIDASGSDSVKVLAQAGNLLNNNQGIQLQNSMQYWIQQDPEYYLKISSNIADLVTMSDFINRDTLPVDFVPFRGSKMFSNMDRYVYSAQDYHFGLSMYSNRVSAYATGNKENLKGWHMADGMVYLQNEDKQFGKSYWATVDMYRLPGITVDTRTLEDTTEAWVSYLSPQKWVGGTSSDTNAVIGMQLDKNDMKNNGKNIGMDLTAKKSWFVMDGKIVALGTDINGKTPATIETVVENRILDSDIGYKLVDQDKKAINDGNYDMKKGDWMILEAYESSNNLAYMMLQEQAVTIQTETNTDTYLRHSATELSGNEYTDTYKKIIVNHGANAQEATYAYVMAPAVEINSLSTVEESFEIIENNKDVQAVLDEKHNTLGINVWSQGPHKVMDYTIYSPASVLIDEQAKSFEINIADPTQEQDSIMFSTNVEFSEVILPANVSQIGNNVFVVDTRNSNGVTTTITLNKKEKETPETGGETTPETGGESTPETSGETTPETGGETTPETTTPEQGGETTPKPDAEVNEIIENDKSSDSSFETLPLTGVSGFGISLGAMLTIMGVIVFCFDIKKKLKKID